MMRDKRLMANTVGAGAVVVVAVVVTALIALTRPPVERVERVNPGELVSVIEVEKINVAPRVQAQGTVVPARRVNLRPQVSGRVLARHPNLVTGGVVRRGETLLRIDPRDFEISVSEAQNGVERAQAELALEEGRQVVARQEWERFGDGAEAPPPLALREPQRRQAELQIEAARNALDRARLDLDRTRMLAPFTALVLEASVEPGELISSSSTAAELVALDEFWVQVSVPLESLDMLAIPGRDGDSGSHAEIRHQAGERVVTHHGQVVRLLGELDPTGRMARVLVRVPDPFAMIPAPKAGAGTEQAGEAGASSSSDEASESPKQAARQDHDELVGGGAPTPTKLQRAPLMLGAYVTVFFEGAESRDVVEVPRRAVHNGDEVYVVGAEGRLEIRRVEFAWRGPEMLAVARGLEGGERVIISPLAAPVAGMKLRVAERGEGGVEAELDGVPFEPTPSETSQEEPSGLQGELLDAPGELSEPEGASSASQEEPASAQPEPAVVPSVPEHAPAVLPASEAP